MILSASRRTDIPAFYSEWFFNRLKEGYALVRNPMNCHQVSRIPLSAEIVDCIVFWTKNPAPMLSRLDELKGYNYYFQFTLNSYGRDMEGGVPSKLGEVCDTFRSLADRIGSKRVIWRYDPIIVNDNYSAESHIRNFELLSERLYGSFGRCVISFVDLYRKSASVFREHHISETAEDNIRRIAQQFSVIAESGGFEISTCAEQIDLSEYGIQHGSCIDSSYIQRLFGLRLGVPKDKNQRESCGCAESVDIGAYNTCPHDCRYCYANFSREVTAANIKRYDPNSPLLCSVLTDDDRITDRKVKPLADCQMTLF